MLDTDLPEVIGRYFDAHDRRDTDAALATFAADAVVLDDGHEYRSPEEIRDWLARASTQFTYTRTFTGRKLSHPRRGSSRTVSKATSRGESSISATGSGSRTT